jgi:ABC-type multidrug transport system ATPase subunit
MALQELYVDSVSHYYGHKLVLNNAYIKCNIGEVIGLLGRNGSGKSTLLRIIYGSLTPHFKHLKLNGELIKKPYLTNKIAYLPQDFFVPKYMRVNELVNLYSSTYKEELLSINTIDKHLCDKIGDLSGGERRLIECLLIIYSNSTFVLLDEPFSQVSPLIIKEIQSHIIKFRSTKGFIITDHYYEQILDIATRTVLLHNGANYPINGIDDLKLHGYLPNN